MRVEKEKKILWSCNQAETWVVLAITWAI